VKDWDERREKVKQQKSEKKKTRERDRERGSIRNGEKRRG